MTLFTLLAGPLPGLKNPAVSSNVGFITCGRIGNRCAQDIIQLLLQNLLNVAFGLVGFILLVMLIRGGYQYVTAGGDKESIQKATKSMTTALVGTVILLSIFAIITAVEILFGINLRSPTFPTL